MGILNILYITKFKQNIVYISFFEEKNLFKKYALKVLCLKSFLQCPNIVPN